MELKITLPNLNPFARFFKGSRTKREELLTAEKAKNSQAVSQTDIATKDLYKNQQHAQDGSIVVSSIQWDQEFNSKKERVYKYREMANYPEIEESVEFVCDDSIVADDEGDIVHLDIKEELPPNIQKKIQLQWNYIINDVFNFNEKGWEIFKLFLIDAEVYAEKILNSKANSIIGLKFIPPYTIAPVYNHGSIIGFTQNPDVGAVNAPQYGQTTEKKSTDFDVDQIAYAFYPGKPGKTIIDVRGYLESAIKVYNQLKNVEDAEVVGKMARAPLRRKFEVDVGRMTKSRAENYLKGLIQRFRKRMYYDPSTGAVNAAENHMSFTEDYWFAKSTDSAGTTIEHVESNANFGEMTMANYFAKKVYKCLKIPRSRYEDAASVYFGGKSGEIAREEIKFSFFCSRCLNAFKPLIQDTFLTQLKLQGFEERYLRPELYNIWFTQSNMFREYKENELLDARLAILTTVSSYIYNEDNKTGLFDPDFVLRRFFKMRDKDFEENQSMLKSRQIAQTLKGGEGQEANGEMGGGESPLNEPEIPSSGPVELGPPPEGNPNAEVERPGGEGNPPEAPGENAPEETIGSLVAPESRVISPKTGFVLFDQWQELDQEITMKNESKSISLDKDAFLIDLLDNTN